MLCSITKAHYILAHGAHESCFLLSLHAILSPESHTGKRDVVFLIDGSDESRSGFPAIRDFVRRVVENLDVAQKKDRIAVVQYSKDTAVHFYLSSYSTKDNVIMKIRTLRHKGGRPRNTGAALQYVQDNIFSTVFGSRHLEGVPQVLILLSGGASNDNVWQQDALLQHLDILSFSIGTDPSGLPSTATRKSFVFPISDFGELPDTLMDVLFNLKRVAFVGKFTC